MAFLETASSVITSSLPAVSGVLGRFHEVGDLVVGDTADIASGVRFDDRNSGGGIRPLPPVLFYRG